MIFRNLLNYINQFFLFFTKKTRKLYLTSNIYNKKISSTNNNNFEYKPSPSLLDCLIKYNKKKIKIENYSINHIKKLNKKVGISLNPETNIDVVTNFLNEVNLILIMSVHPGFGGQKFMPEVLDKIKELKKIKEKKKLDFDIEIDGGINFNNNKLAIEAGANILVSGTTIFKNNDGNIKKNIDLLKSS